MIYRKGVCYGSAGIQSDDFRLKKLVANGNVESMRCLGDLYYQGISGTDENTFAALPYWKMAADHGNNDMAFKVGLCLMAGIGCEENDV